MLRGVARMIAGGASMTAIRLGVVIAVALSTWSASPLPARADCVSECQASTYCDYEMEASGECARRLNDCYLDQCNRTRYGALAYDAESGAYGWSNDLDDTAAAEAQALANCREHGDNCAVVVDFWNSCAAVAASDAIVAYGLGDTRAAAEHQALGSCADDGGKDCAIQVWSCTE
jgi:hypothetical protein